MQFVVREGRKNSRIQVTIIQYNIIEALLLKFGLCLGDETEIETSSEELLDSCDSFLNLEEDRKEVLLDINGRARDLVQLADSSEKKVTEFIKDIKYSLESLDDRDFDIFVTRKRG